eukprot:PhF_6_TR44181/c0_g1_i3/m.67723
MRGKFLTRETKTNSSLPQLDDIRIGHHDDFSYIRKIFQIFRQQAKPDDPIPIAQLESTLKDTSNSQTLPNNSIPLQEFLQKYPKYFFVRSECVSRKVPYQIESSIDKTFRGATKQHRDAVDVHVLYGSLDRDTKMKISTAVGKGSSSGANVSFRTFLEEYMSHRYSVESTATGGYVVNDVVEMMRKRDKEKERERILLEKMRAKPPPRPPPPPPPPPPRIPSPPPRVKIKTTTFTFADRARILRLTWTLKVLSTTTCTFELLWDEFRRFINRKKSLEGLTQLDFGKILHETSGWWNCPVRC